MNEPAEPRSIRLVAGGWFAAASGVPLSVLWIEFISDAAGREWYVILAGILMYGLLPISVTAFVASNLGAAILDVDRVGTSRQAFSRGAKIAALSFFSYTILLGLGGGILFSVSEHTPGSDRFIEVPMLFFGTLFLVPVLSFFIVGWFAVIVGATAGWLLYKSKSIWRRHAA